MTTNTDLPPTKKGLGKGLSALFAEELSSASNDAKSGFIPELAIADIVPNPKQPRAEIKPEELVGLADSIREYGIIEPLIVSKLEGDKFQLIAGERRWRAAKLAHVHKVPVIVKEATSQQLLELALIENIQRKDLNALEEAAALAELYTNYRLKLDDLAKKVGRDMTTISNKMRLLKLPQTVQQGLLQDKITESHAYALLALKSSDALLAAYNIVAKRQLSVSQTKELVRKITLANIDVIPASTKQNAIIYDEKTAAMETKLRAGLGKGFKLVRKRDGGRVTVPFTTDAQLEAIAEFLLSKRFMV